ncbi:hypothetical protein D3C80_557850 [compost metagenome]
MTHQLLGAQDAAQQIIEVVGNAATELAYGLHLLCLAQRRFGLGQAFLLLHSLTDVIGEQKRALYLALGVAQGVEAQLIMTHRGGLAEGADLDELLACQGALPHRQNRRLAGGAILEQPGQVFADFGCPPVQQVEVMPGLAIDRQPAQVLVDHMHIDHTVID